MDRSKGRVLRSHATEKPRLKTVMTTLPLFGASGSAFLAIWLLRSLPHGHSDLISQTTCEARPYFSADY
jgi:hypothetical protein